MKKKLLIPIVIIFIISIAYYMYNIDIYNKVWNNYKNSISSDDISSISMNSNISVELVNKDKNEFIEALKKATYYKSNKEGYGTTGVPILIKHKDGTEDHIEYMGGKRFEVVYDKKSFFIESIDLKQIFDKNNIKIQ